MDALTQPSSKDSTATDKNQVLCRTGQVIKFGTGKKRDRKEGSEEARKGTLRWEGQLTLGIYKRYERGVVILPDHLLAGVCPSPGQSTQPPSKASGALCGSAEPGSWVLALCQPLAFCLQFICFTQTGVCFLLQLNVTLYSIPVTKHEIPLPHH